MSCSSIELARPRAELLRVLAPLEETSDSESTGGSIPYANDDEEQPVPRDADQGGEKGEEDEEEEGV